MMRDVLLAIRADEGHHREVNHTLGSMRPSETNPFGHVFVSTAISVHTNTLILILSILRVVDNIIGFTLHVLDIHVR